MRISLMLAALVLAACKPSRPMVEVPVPASAPALGNNAVEKYVGGLQDDVKRAQEVKAKAEAANKRSEDSGKIPE